MIAEECKRLREQLEEVAKAEERESIVEQLEARRTELIELRNAVTVVTNSLKAIASRTEIVGQLDSTKSVERIQRIRDALKNDPLSITKGRDFSYMKSACDKFAEEGASAVELTWGQFHPKARPSVDMNQLAQAEQLEAFKGKAAKLRSRAQYADQMGKRPPATEGELEELESAWEEIRRMISELPAVADDPKVQEFPGSGWDCAQQEGSLRDRGGVCQPSVVTWMSIYSVNRRTSHDRRRWFHEVLCPSSQ